MLKKERLQRLHIPVKDNTCCLCEEGIAETHQYLLMEYNWIPEVSNDLSTWSGIQTSGQGSGTKLIMAEEEEMKTYEEGSGGSSKGSNDLPYMACKELENI